MDTILEIKNLELSFSVEEAKLKALHGINFSLKKNKTLGVVGESGCGKSITAMSIIKLLPGNALIENGEIIYKQKNLLDLSNNEMQKIRGNQISLISQDPMTSLNPLYTIGEQVSETIRFHQNKSKKEAKELAVKALKDVNIPESARRYDEYPHQLSGGMRQRVVIAIALSCNPDVIIADEPTTALDVTVQAQILNLMNSLQEKKGTSILMITHNLAVVSETCDDVIVMYAGNIVEKGPVREVFSSPGHPYTRALLESIPSEDTKELKTIGGQPPSISDNITGCPFHVRCQQKIDKCSEIKPCIKKVGENHFSMCHLN